MCVCGGGGDDNTPMFPCCNIFVRVAMHTNQYLPSINTRRTRCFSRNQEIILLIINALLEMEVRKHAMQLYYCVYISQVTFVSVIGNYSVSKRLSSGSFKSHR